MVTIFCVCTALVVFAYLGGVVAYLKYYKQDEAAADEADVARKKRDLEEAEMRQAENNEKRKKRDDEKRKKREAADEAADDRDEKDATAERKRLERLQVKITKHSSV